MRSLCLALPRCWASTARGGPRILQRGRVGAGTGTSGVTALPCRGGWVDHAAGLPTFLMRSKLVRIATSLLLHAQLRISPLPVSLSPTHRCHCPWLPKGGGSSRAVSAYTSGPSCCCCTVLDLPPSIAPVDFSGSCSHPPLLMGHSAWGTLFE